MTPTNSINVIWSCNFLNFVHIPDKPGQTHNTHDFDKILSEVCLLRFSLQTIIAALFNYFDCVTLYLLIYLFTFFNLAGWLQRPGIWKWLNATGHICPKRLVKVSLRYNISHVSRDYAMENDFSSRVEKCQKTNERAQRTRKFSQVAQSAAIREMFDVRAPDWLPLESRQIIFTLIFANKTSRNCQKIHLYISPTSVNNPRKFSMIWFFVLRFCLGRLFWLHPCVVESCPATGCRNIDATLQNAVSWRQFKIF